VKAELVEVKAELVEVKAELVEVSIERNEQRKHDLNRRIEGKTADLFKMFIDKVLHTRYEHDPILKDHDGYDIVNALQSVKRSEDARKLKQDAKGIIVSLGMNCEAVSVANGKRHSRNGSSHFIREKKFDNRLYMEQQVAEFEKDLLEWGKECEDNEQEAVQLIDFGRRTVELAFEGVGRGCQ
jgi:hypothetical protein